MGVGRVPRLKSGPTIMMNAHKKASERVESSSSQTSDLEPLTHLQPQPGLQSKGDNGQATGKTERNEC